MVTLSDLERGSTLFALQTPPHESGPALFTLTFSTQAVHLDHTVYTLCLWMQHEMVMFEKEPLETLGNVCLPTGSGSRKYRV